MVTAIGATAPAWRLYQEEAAEFFRSLGLEADTDVTLKGVRTSHDVDVLVTLDVAGFAVRWLVECKHWQEPVSKLHVMALREIVSDLGADRGIMLCEVGFQSGAIEAASLTNVQVTSLAALSVSSRESIAAVRLRDLLERTHAAKQRYWDIPKDVRIARGLRFDLGEPPLYSGARIVEVAEQLLGLAFRKLYPIQVDAFQKLFAADLPDRLTSSEEVVVAVESMISELEARLAAVAWPPDT
jgi:restriction system protein